MAKQPTESSEKSVVVVDEKRVHVLRVLGPEGDVKFEWNDPAGTEAKAAKKEFDARIPTHQAVADGKPTREFNGNAWETTMFPQMQAGMVARLFARVAAFFR
jgi:hypothetical protein